MKDMNGKEVHIWDTVLIPIESESIYNHSIKNEICEKFIVVPALLDSDGNLHKYVQDNVFLLEK